MLPFLLVREYGQLTYGEDMNNRSSVTNGAWHSTEPGSELSEVCLPHHGSLDGALTRAPCPSAPSAARVLAGRAAIAYGMHKSQTVDDQGRFEGFGSPYSMNTSSHIHKQRPQHPKQ